MAIISRRQVRSDGDALAPFLLQAMEEVHFVSREFFNLGVVDITTFVGLGDDAQKRLRIGDRGWALQHSKPNRPRRSGSDRGVVEDYLGD